MKRGKTPHRCIGKSNANAPIGPRENFGQALKIENQLVDTTTKFVAVQSVLAQHLKNAEWRSAMLAARAPDK
jgi:hypothetical protein